MRANQRDLCIAAGLANGLDQRELQRGCALEAGARTLCKRMLGDPRRMLVDAIEQPYEVRFRSGVELRECECHRRLLPDERRLRIERMQRPPVPRDIDAPRDPHPFVML